MVKTEQIMGMHISVEIVGYKKVEEFDKIFDYFRQIDKKFSPYKLRSLVALINEGTLNVTDAGEEMEQVIRLSQAAKHQTGGYFDVYHNGKLDPSGIVKGWAIYNASQMLKNDGFVNFFIDAGGDIQVGGKNPQNNVWRIGIKNPFNQSEIVKVIGIGESGEGVATSGTYIRGDHIYDPVEGKTLKKVLSLTVIGPNVLEADIYATAAFAMGERGIAFIEKLAGFEGYQIDTQGIATMTSGFERYILTR